MDFKTTFEQAVAKKTEQSARDLVSWLVENNKEANGYGVWNEGQTEWGCYFQPDQRLRYRNRKWEMAEVGRGE